MKNFADPCGLGINRFADKDELLSYGIKFTVLAGELKLGIPEDLIRECQRHFFHRDDMDAFFKHVLTTFGFSETGILVQSTGPQGSMVVSQKITEADHNIRKPDALPTQIIAFSGLRRAGKDSAAKVLIEYGYQLIKMADCLKDMLRVLLRYAGCPEDQIERYIEGDLKEEPTPYLQGKSTRHAMITLGTEWGRDQISKNLWTSIAIAQASKYKRAVFSDVRFPNEVEAIHKAGGRVFRVVRPSMADVLNHESENQISTLDADYEIINDGTLADLRAKVLTSVYGNDWQEKRS